jgi:hypothetical protein
MVGIAHLDTLDVLSEGEFENPLLQGVYHADAIQFASKPFFGLLL